MDSLCKKASLVSHLAFYCFIFYLLSVILSEKVKKLTLSDQVLMLQAASEGYLDDVPIRDLRGFERAFLAHFNGEHPAVASQIDRRGESFDEFDEMEESMIALARYRVSHSNFKELSMVRYICTRIK